MSDTARIDKVVLIESTGTELGVVRRRFCGRRALDVWTADCDLCEESPLDRDLNRAAAVAELLFHLRAEHGVEA